MGRAVRGWRALAGAFAALAFALTLLSWNPLVRVASNEAGATVAATVTVYAGLRAFNAILSTAQEVEVSGSAVVVGGSARPLKILEPVDDTIETVAGAVLAVSVAAGLLMLGFGPLSAVGWALVGAGVALWERGPDFARRLVTVGAMLAVVLPAIFIMSGLVGDVMTRTVWEENRAVLDRIAERTGAEAMVTDAVPQAEGDAVGEETGLWGWMRSWRGGPDGGEGAMDRIGRYSTAAFVLMDEAEPLLRSYVAILAVWLLKLVALPLVLMLVALRVIR